MRGRAALERALNLIYGPRRAAYGHPLDNHQRIADFWTVRMRDKLKPGEVFEPFEVTALMRLAKEARLMETPGHEDSLTDIPGYAGVELDIHEELERRAGRTPPGTFD